MILDDFVLLGSAAPEQRKSGAVSVCTAGYSLEMNQLIRVYPVEPRAGLRRWRKYRISLRRNPKDSREESWRLDENDKPECVGEVRRDDRFDEVSRFVVPSIQFLNDNRASLGVIEPRNLSVGVVPSPVSAPLLNRLPGFGLPSIPARSALPYLPRISFDDLDGRHDLNLLEWGACELVRKNREHQLRQALRIDGPQRRVLLFVGNLARFRRSFAVISCLTFWRAQQLGLFAGRGAA